GADGVEGGHGVADHAGELPLAVVVRGDLPAGGGVDDGTQGGGGPIVGDVERGLDDVVDARAGGDGGRDHGGEDAGRLAAVARLVGAGDVDRLGVGATWVPGVGQPDGRHVHRGAAVDDVPDAGLARVDVAVV